ncbi:HAD-IIIC family phosphatase [Acetobacter pasteurianus]
MSQNFKLTKEFLASHIWSWGGLNEPPLTTSLRFSDDGFITGYSHPNEHMWKINNNSLEILSISGDVSWEFKTFLETDSSITFIALPNSDPNWKTFFGLTTNKKSSSSAPTAKEEGIRLVIWDLDDTFWEGTLSEGEISPIQRNIDIVKTLNGRGIVNAICSRNTFEDVKARLEQLGIWDEFVFPRISWGPKGPLVKDIIEKIQLRPETVMFVDDNVTNLNEAKHFVPELNVAEPDVLESLLDNPRFKGKPDPEYSRLKRYQVLESKHKDMAATGGDNEAFLRKSDIRVSFHSDIEAEFPRIHDLVNRTNQLNFTKNRWPEDIEEARLRFREEVEADFDTDVGYVKVADAYGNYGICGFYLSRKDEFLHFLFSCRTMNMGVEQFVWRRLGERHVPIQGKVGSKLEDPIVDWINVVEDVDKATGNTSNNDKLSNLTICLRGACDLMMTSNFLRTRVSTIEEFNYAYEEWEIVTTPRILALHEDLKDERNQDIIARLPGIPSNRFDSAVITETADVYVLSFSQESFHGLYESKSTGMILPMGTYHFPYYLPEGPTAKFDYTSFTYQDILDRGMSNVSEEQWNFFRNEFSFRGGFDKFLFIHDLHYTFNRLKNSGKKVIILGLNDKIGSDVRILEFFSKINEIVSNLAMLYDYPVINMRDFVNSEDDLANDGMKGGTHFNRAVYKSVSDAIIESILITL